MLLSLLSVFSPTTIAIVIVCEGLDRLEVGDNTKPQANDYGRCCYWSLEKMTSAGPDLDLSVVFVN